MKYDNQISGGVRMDNTVFERNYEKPQEDMEYCTAVFEQAVDCLLYTSDAADD